MSGDVKVYGKDYRPVIVDLAGRLLTCPYGELVTHQSFGAVSLRINIPGTVRLLKAQGYCSAPGQFVQLHDLGGSGAPAANSIPLTTIATAAGLGQNWLWDFGLIGGLLFSNGICIAGSSTGGVFTQSPSPCLNGLVSFLVVW